MNFSRRQEWAQCLAWWRLRALLVPERTLSLKLRLGRRVHSLSATSGTFVNQEWSLDGWSRAFVEGCSPCSPSVDHWVQDEVEKMRPFPVCRFWNICQPKRSLDWCWITCPYRWLLYFSVLEWPIVVIRAGFPSSQYLKNFEKFIYLFEMAIDVHSGTVSITGLLVRPPGLTCRPKMGPEKGFSLLPLLLPLPLPLLATPGMVFEHVSVSMIG